LHQGVSGSFICKLRLARGTSNKCYDSIAADNDVQTRLLLCTGEHFRILHSQSAAKVASNGPEYVVLRICQASDALKQATNICYVEGLGYVKVDHPEAYNNLPTPLADFSSTVFTTAMTHQLHCLYAIVEVFSGLTSNNTDKVPKETPWHLNHCFEYLRQSIMCCGDIALEGQATTFPQGVTGSDGWDSKHVCKDYRQIFEYLEENRANDDVWI
jgi:hypothetical protein